MLSVLIPLFDENALPLVEELLRQCREAKIEYEILVRDDDSKSGLNVYNTRINSLPGCRFSVNSHNLGRAGNRNELAAEAKFGHLLFIDGDTMPGNDFIKKYLEVLDHDVVFGGLAYEAAEPEKSRLLRWIYGKQREALPADIRSRNPYATALTSNLLIKAELFRRFKFDAGITEYGFEDAEFIRRLQQSGVPIMHIDNAVFHLGLDVSEVFLDKTRKSLDNLGHLYKNGILGIQESKVLKAYLFLAKMGMLNMALRAFIRLRNRLERNLLSGHPSMTVFDLYKLGYFIQVNGKPSKK